MCGIFGVSGSGEAASQVLSGLLSLEYRGYDSAGVALSSTGKVTALRRVGRVGVLAEAVRADAAGAAARSALGHVRWATHGGVTEANAHPHSAGGMALVHNGVVENHGGIRAALKANGHVFLSETDTEVLIHFLHAALGDAVSVSSRLVAVREVLEATVGTLAFAVIFPDGSIAAARRGAPLSLACRDGTGFVSSDLVALAPFSDEASSLEDGDVAIFSPGDQGWTVRREPGKPPFPQQKPHGISPHSTDLGPWPHYMLKEIHEQPASVSATVESILDLSRPPLLPSTGIRRVSAAACGSAYLACLAARSVFETVAGIPLDAEIASEYRTRPVLDTDGVVFLAVSQSGETLDTLEAMRHARSSGLLAQAIVNVRGSAMASEADAVSYTEAGTEVAVASTKAFTAQIAALSATALRLALDRGVIERASFDETAEDLRSAPSLLSGVLDSLDAGSSSEAVASAAAAIASRGDALFTGRGPAWALAQEGALKLKEISYVRAEGHAAGELKHGTIALVDDGCPVVAIAPPGPGFSKTASAVQEVAARGAHVLLISDAAGCESLSSVVRWSVPMPDCRSEVATIAYALPLQRLAYETALLLGRDVDRPRNLAKSVTVI
jgi:glucosamine--fructose-6-phosphate aminotransferase (isomerizing)